MKSSFWSILFKSLGVALFILILTRINWGLLLKIIFSGDFSNFVYYLVSLALLYPLLLVKSYRWRVIQHDLGIDISQHDAAKYYMIGLFAGAATPGQLGDFIKTIYLNKKGFPGGASFFGVLFDRIFDLLFLAFITLFGLIFLSGEQHLNSPLIIVAACLFILFFVLFLLNQRFRNFIAIDLFKYVLPSGIKQKLKSYDISADAPKYRIRKSSFLFAALLTAVSYCIVFYRYYLLMATLRFEMPLGIWFGGVALASFVTLIPVSISGVGTRDAVLIGVFGTVGLEPEKAVAFSLLILSLMILNGIVGMIVWMKNPLLPKNNLPL